MHQLRHSYVRFSMFASSTSFLKRGALPERAGLLWYHIVHLKLVGLCERNVGLNTKCALVKVSENVKEHGPLSQAPVKIINTKNKTLFECVTKNSKRLIFVTNQLEIFHRAASKVFSGYLIFTPIPLLLIETKHPC